MSINRGKNIIKFVVVVVVLLLLHYSKILFPIELFLSKILNPLFGSFYSVGISVGNFFDTSLEKKELIKENEELKKENNFLIEENVKMKIYQEENDILRDHLGFVSRNQYAYVMANIISRDSSSNVSGLTELIILDRGSKDGIEIGQAVVSSEGIIIGKIVSVKDENSEVALTNSSKCKLAAMLFNDEKTSGIVEGELGLTLKMGFIPQSQDIREGGIVVTSGLETNVPRGLIIGRIIKTEKESNDLWQNAFIEPLVDVEKLIIVSVIK